MKTYTKNTMGLISSPELLITTCIGGTFITAQLQELPDILERDGLERHRPMGTTVDGVKNGIFPVLSPMNIVASLAFKVKGYDIPVGDGLSCVSQAAACNIAAALVELGIALEDLSFEWMIGQPQGATRAQLDAALQPRKSKFTDEERAKAIAEQMADSPF